MNSKNNAKSFFNYIFLSITLVSAIFILLIFLGLVFSLFWESSLAIRKFGVLQFLISTDWNPVKSSFGALTSIYGTVVVSFLALIFAVPIAISISIFITEIVHDKLRNIIGFAAEFLAGIPSIIYGMWGFFTFSPIMRIYVEPFLKKITAPIPLIHVLFENTPRGIDILTASVVLGIMIIPFTASIARDSFKLVPNIVKESAYAIGATKWEVIKNIVIPHARLGVMGGIFLSLARAIGETMAIAFVLGNNHKITFSLLDAASTITVTLANEFAEADNPIYLSSLFYLALVLLCMSFVSFGSARYFLKKVRKNR